MSIWADDDATGATAGERTCLLPDPCPHCGATGDAPCAEWCTGGHVDASEPPTLAGELRAATEADDWIDERRAA